MFRSEAANTWMGPGSGSKLLTPEEDERSYALSGDHSAAAHFEIAQIRLRLGTLEYVGRDAPLLGRLAKLRAQEARLTPPHQPLAILLRLRQIE
jgi:hypothetical protein